MTAPPALAALRPASDHPIRSAVPGLRRNRAGSYIKGGLRGTRRQFRSTSRSDECRRCGPTPFDTTGRSPRPTCQPFKTPPDSRQGAQDGRVAWQRGRRRGHRRRCGGIAAAPAADAPAGPVGAADPRRRTGPARAHTIAATRRPTSAAPASTARSQMSDGHRRQPPRLHGPPPSRPHGTEEDSDLGSATTIAKATTRRSGLSRPRPGRGPDGGRRAAVRPRPGRQPLARPARRRLDLCQWRRTRRVSVQDSADYKPGEGDDWRVVEGTARWWPSWARHPGRCSTRAVRRIDHSGAAWIAIETDRGTGRARAVVMTAFDQPMLAKTPEGTPLPPRDPTSRGCGRHCRSGLADKLIPAIMRPELFPSRVTARRLRHGRHRRTYPAPFADPLSSASTAVSSRATSSGTGVSRASPRLRPRRTGAGLLGAEAAAAVEPGPHDRLGPRKPIFSAPMLRGAGGRGHAGRAGGAGRRGACSSPARATHATRFHHRRTAPTRRASPPPRRRWRRVGQARVAGSD